MEKRILIADTSAEFCTQLRNLLGKGPNIRTAHDGSKVLQLLRSFMPEILILDLMLPGIDGLSLLQQAAAEGLRPAVLVTTKLLSEYVSQSLENLQVEYVMVKPCEAAVVAARVEDISERMKQPLFTGPDPKTVISNLLLELGIPTKLKGYGYLRLAIEIFAEDPTQAITKQVYKAVGERCGATETQVERSVRTAIGIAWEQTDRKIWRRYFAREEAEGARPTNGTVISRLAEHLIARRHSSQA